MTTMLQVPELVLTFPEYRDAGERLAAELNCTSAAVDVYRFPDGEARVRLPEKLPRRIALCRSLFDPDAKLIELLLVSRTARELGARHISLVAPYLCYMRQDRAFVRGEAVSQRIVGDFLARLFDALITVDPHLHRIERLDQALPMDDAVSVSAAQVLANFLRQHLQPETLLVGPDSESRQWVAAIAARCDCDFLIAQKARHSDRAVDIELLDTPVSGRPVVLVDDIVSTGHTLATAARKLRAGGASIVDALITHGLFQDDAEDRLRAAGIRHVWTSDSVPHPSNAANLAPLLAEALTMPQKQ